MNDSKEALMNDLFEKLHIDREVFLHSFRTNWGSYVLTVCFLCIISFMGIKQRNTFLNFAHTMVTGDAEEKKDALNTLESTAQKETFSKESAIEMDGLLYNMTNRSEMNDVVKLKNGHLTSIRKSPTPAPQNADAIAYMHQFMDVVGIPFVFVYTPYNICGFDRQLPEGYEDYTAEDGQVFLDALAEYEVPVLNLHDKLHEDGLDHYDSFFKTDHHWTIETSFWAFTKIAEYMEENFGFEIDEECTDLENYTIETYKNSYLGSKGKRTGRYFGGLDDFSLIYPNFDTDMTLSIPSADIYNEGSFYDTQFFMDRLFADGDPSKTSVEDLTYLNAYDVYIGGVYDKVIHTNPNAKTDKTLLLIKDSYLSPVESFLSTCFTNVVAIDMRQFDGSIRQLVEEIGADAVICSYNEQMVINAELFWFSYSEKKAPAGNESSADAQSE